MKSKAPRLGGLILGIVAQVIGYLALTAVLLALYFEVGAMVRGWLS